MPGISIIPGTTFRASDYVPVYGNYCGPGWTGGQRGGDYSVAPIDAMDALCRDHDIQYGYAANDAANSARIIADADIALLRGISNLLVQNALPNTPPEMQLDAAGIAYAGLAAQAFSAKVMTIDTYNGLKGEVQNMLQGMSDFIRQRSGVPLSYTDQFGTTGTLMLDDTGHLLMTSQTTLDDGSTLYSETIASSFEDSAGEVGYVTALDGSVDVFANGDGESVSLGNAEVWVTEDSTVAIDQPGSTVHAAGQDEINVYTNNTTVSANDSEINFCYTDYENNYVQGYDNTVDFYYTPSCYSGAYGFRHEGGDSRNVGFTFEELDDTPTVGAGHGGIRHASVKVSSATPVSVEQLIQSIAAFGTRSEGVIDGFSFSTSAVPAPAARTSWRGSDLLAMSR